jgi:hypothetical protein
MPPRRRHSEDLSKHPSFKEAARRRAAGLVVGDGPPVGKYRAMLSCSHEDGFLESFFRSDTRLKLLLEFYKNAEDYKEILLHLSKIALHNNVRVPLERRLEWLRSCLDAMTQVGSSKEINEVSAKLKQVEIQQSILFKLPAADADLVDRLHFSVVDPEALCEAIAEPNRLYGECLLLQHIYLDGEIIDIWRSAICDEVLPCATRSERARRYLRRFAAAVGQEDRVRLLASDDPAGDESSLFEEGHWIARVEERVAQLGRETLWAGGPALPVTFLTETLFGESVLFSGSFLLRSE